MRGTRVKELHHQCADKIHSSHPLIWSRIILVIHTLHYSTVQYSTVQHSTRSLPQNELCVVRHVKELQLSIAGGNSFKYSNV